MIKMFFYIQFRAQLRRTRPELIASLEDTVASSAVSAGGVVENGRKVLGASFDENSLGFWLDMVIFLEKALRIYQKRKEHRKCVLLQYIIGAPLLSLFRRNTKHLKCALMP
jgi:hypothetical protein